MRANNRLALAKNRKLLLEVLEDRWVPAAVNYVPDELLVSFKPGTPAVVMNQTLGQANASVAEVIQTPTMKQSGAAPLHLWKLNGVAIDKAMAALARNPNVAFAEPNFIYTKQAVTNDPYYTNGNLWGMYSPDSLGNNDPVNAFGSQANKAWAAGYTGSRTVYVGIIDEGYQYTHPDLAANAGKTADVPGNGLDDDGNGFVDDTYGWDFANNDNTIYDGTVDDHGTHVAGTIGGQGGNNLGVVGVNWNVSLISAKFLGRNGGTTANAIKAIDYLTNLKTAEGLNIVATNNSWGGGGFSSALQDAIERANQANILFIAAAGNNGSNNDTIANYPSNYPNANVIAVAAVDSAGALASFSNYGVANVDIAAPGVGIWSSVPVNTYNSYNGTSMATPHVTGAAALYASSHAGASAATIKNALLAGATSNSAQLVNKVVGGRLLNVWGSMNVGALDPAPLPSISINNVSATEGNSGNRNFVFTLSLSAPAPGGVSVSWATAPGLNNAATAGVDFISASGVLTLAAGTTTATITVSVVGDSTVESEETFLVNLSAPVGAVLGSSASGVGTIVNDDGTTGGKPKPRSAGSAGTTGSADSVFSNGLTIIPDASLINWLSDQGKKPA